MANNRSTLNLSLGTVGAVNLGSGSNIFKEINPINNLNFKTLSGGTGISLIDDGSVITITASTGGSGETNAGVNVGTGIGIYTGKTGVNLQFKSLVAGTNITLDDSNPDEILISAATGLGGADGVVSGATLDLAGTLSLARTESLSDVVVNLSSLYGLTGATNGLTADSTDVCLGGSLTQNTTICGGNGTRIFTVGINTSDLGEFNINACCGNFNFCNPGFPTNNTFTLTSSFLCATAKGGLNVGYGNMSAAAGGSILAGDANASIQGLVSFGHGDKVCTPSGSRAVFVGGSANFTDACPVFACSCGFNWSLNNNTSSGQTSNGARAVGSAILGGLNHQISTAGQRSVIIGGNASIICSSQSAIIGGNENKIYSGGNGGIFAGNGNIISSNANLSSIIGGCLNNIDDVDTSVILGGFGITASTSTYDRHAIADNLAIWSTPAVSSASDCVLLWNPTTKKVTQNTCATVSDCRLKTDYNQIDVALCGIEKIPAYVHKFNTDLYNKQGCHYGLFAQEVEKEFPYVVKEELKLKLNDEITYKTIEYRELVPVLWKAIQEMKQEYTNEIIQLKERIIKLENRNNS